MTLLLTLPRAEVAIRLRCCAPDLTAPNLPCGGDGVPDLCCIKETCPFAECHMDRIIVRRVESPLWAKVLFSWHGSTLLLWVAIAAFATVLALAVWAWTRPISSNRPGRAASRANQRIRHGRCRHSVSRLSPRGRHVLRAGRREQDRR